MKNIEPLHTAHPSKAPAGDAQALAGEMLSCRYEPEARDGGVIFEPSEDGSVVLTVEAVQIVAGLLADLSAARAQVAHLTALAEHLRQCRECGETDVENCDAGLYLWNAALSPTPGAQR